MVNRHFAIIKTLFFSFIPFVLFCSKIVDSGGGIDVGNPFRIFVIDQDKRPVTNASVKIIPSKDWLDNTINGKKSVTDTFITDQSGRVTLDSLDNGTYNIQVDHTNSGALFTGYNPADSLSDMNIIVEDYGSVSGTINSSSYTPSVVHFAGTDYQATVNSDGSYVVPRIAEGTFSTMVMSIDSLWAVSSSIKITSSEESVNNRDVSFSSLLIEDFEKSPNTSSLTSILKGSRMYTWKDSGTTEYKIVPEDQKGGNALQCLLIREGTKAIIVGLFIGFKSDGDSLWDFTEATGLSFYGKGSGKIYISFESDTLDKLGFMDHHYAEISFEHEWQHFTISFDTLSLPKETIHSGPKLAWKECAPSIKRIEFNFLEGDTAQFWIDDIRVHGVDLSAIY